MNERQTFGVKCKASDRIRSGAIFLVSCNGVSYPLRVNSDLVLSSCLEFEFHHGIVLSSVSCAAVG